MRGSLVLVIGMLVLASPARADHTSLHATASGDVSTTDNLFAAGSDGDRQADLYLTVRPGLLYAYDAPRMIHEFTAEVEAVEYLVHSDEPSISGRGGWRAVFLPGPRSTASMSIDVGTGVVTSLANRTTADDTMAVAAPAGKVETQQVSAAESLSWGATEHARISQGLTGRYATTDDGKGSTSDTREVAGNFGLERSFNSDSLLLGASVSYLRLQRPVVPDASGNTVGNGQDHQLNPAASLGWHHDHDQRWSSNASGGISFVNPVGNDPKDLTAPHKVSAFWVASAGVAYTELWGRAGLAASRSVAPNLLLAENTIDESVNLQLSMPLPWLDDTKRNPKLVGSGSLGYAHSQLINSDTSSTQSTIDVVHVDLSVGWTPKPGETFGLRYEFVYQTSGASGMMMAGAATFPSYYRNTLSFTFSFRYPERVAGEVPRRDKSLRADHSDLVPAGAEPIVTDPLEGGGDAGDRE